MPHEPLTQASAQTEDSSSWNHSDYDTETAPDSSHVTPIWASTLGVVTHSAYWLQGKSEDTILSNPCFKNSDSARGYAIYCVHGTADGSYAFKKLVDRLLENRPGKTSNWLPESVSTIHLLPFKGESSGVPIEAYAEQLVSYIIKNKDTHVILWGHSRGGDVAAYCAEFLAAKLDITVHGVFAFCSPFAGSSLAIFPLTTLSTSVAEMQPDSPFLKNLRTAMTRTKESRQKYYYFVAGKELLVYPERAVVEGQASHVTLMPDHGHLSILTSRKILKPIRKYLKAVTAHPLAQTLSKELSVRTAYLALEAQHIDLKYRPHVCSSEPKLKILNELKSLFSELATGNRGEHFPEAKTVADFIHQYMQTIDPLTRLSFYKIIEQHLNPSPFSLFWRSSLSRSQTFIKNLICTYQDVPLPEANAPIPEAPASSIPNLILGAM